MCFGPNVSFWRRGSSTLRYCKKWYTKAADQGFALAQTKLGLLYATGKGVPQDYTIANKWWLKAAEQGDGEAQNNIGYSYANGWGVPKDIEVAKQWYLKAIAQGDKTAQINLNNLPSD
ncbi:tetratricopeptide repeat protein [Acinetobacter sp. ABJ_C3_5]|uniref:tetratricopeptide repeat protein n=1 Tax=Acinetobacter courvalinii TaxID=280147 RepID=UPI0037C72AB1